MQELISYLINNRATKERLNSEVKDSDFKTFPKRNLFIKLKQYANDFLTERLQPRLIALSGLRGVGKTTLMWQIAEHIFYEHTKNIFFINVDDLNRLGYNLYQTFNVIENEIFKQPLQSLKEPVVFLIDEVHDAEGWDKDLKIIYEKCKQAFILCTGSSALLLHQSADLASRMTLIKLFPFRFSEFILSKSWMTQPNNLLFPQEGLGQKLKNVLFFSNDIGSLKIELEKIIPEIKSYLSKVVTHFPEKNILELIDEYVSYHNIARFLPLNNKELINDRVIALFERILYKDLPAFNKDLNTEVLFRLLMRLSLSDEVNYQKLAKELKCTEKDVERFIDTLNKAEILNVYLPYGGVKTKTGQNIKPFFMSPSLRCALYTRIYGSNLDENLRAKLYEDIVAMYLRRCIDYGLLSFGVSKNVSPDFIIETMDNPVFMEIGINKKNTKQINKYDGDKRYGIIVNAQITEANFKENCLFIPLSWLLLL